MFFYQLTKEYNRTMQWTVTEIDPINVNTFSIFRLL